MREVSKFKVFVSYAEVDSDRAIKLYKDFIDAGFEAWIDKKSLLPGQNWKSEIKRAIRNSDFVVLLLSIKSIDREGYFYEEIRLALEMQRKKPFGKVYIIPALLDRCRIPDWLEEIHCAKLHPDWDDGIQSIFRAMASISCQEEPKREEIYRHRAFPLLMGLDEFIEQCEKSEIPPLPIMKEWIGDI